MADVLAKDALAVLWSSSDREVACKTAFTYTLNAKCRGWWSEVQLVIWGPSVKLAAEDKDIRVKLTEMMNAGVCISACMENADDYGATDALKDIGINVQYMAEPVTKLLQNGAKLITF